ncbi:putative ATP synthase SpaL [Sodalis glossinidius str. 'morsitans']|uniref:protein-secreting ATPase n=2 Tax=Sodalis glossinidius TaxID=63612 RepID=Q2NVI5_SODGM|nr:type III secretion system ATPase SctN [Sodalis glossinidius]AAS66842.1 YsaN [Sodalis glossinidius]BAE73840.1 type III secretion apparatus SpaL/InvC [Sodalis glossinidius str. 'morsitans']CRL44287.1 putative ATP synthase SpaL [Sodalis glossinidius str. 'morsitans']
MRRSPLQNCFDYAAHPTRIQGNIIEASLPAAAIGEVCEVLSSINDTSLAGYARVIGFNGSRTMLSLLCDSAGFSQHHLLVPTGKPFQFPLGEALLGAVLDPLGNICARLDGATETALIATEHRPIDVEALHFSEREPIAEKLITRIRAIDGLLTCGHGQRLGIFAAAGCGKTSLMNMLIEHSEADVYVVGLIGERGREVTEFIEELKHSSRSGKVVLVNSTSDRSSVERCNAAQVATTVAEYFRDQGKNVLLFIDSITRYARALRDMALSMGELPARRGYPASVFERLPKLLERPGSSQLGSITAFYTVLLENEEEPDAIGDEVRSILDGHIYLSHTLAAQGHYPAIDILRSTSRLFLQITDKQQQRAAVRFRDLLVRQRDMQLYLDLGEYRRGENQENDNAFDKENIMSDFLRQPLDECMEFSQTLERLNECLA